VLDEDALQRTGEDQHAHRIVGQQAVDRRVELADHRGVHVALGRIVETDDGNGVAPFDFDQGHAGLS
jgi:hypothetical protein